MTERLTHMRQGSLQARPLISGIWIRLFFFFLIRRLHRGLTFETIYVFNDPPRWRGASVGDIEYFLLPLLPDKKSDNRRPSFSRRVRVLRE